MRLLLASSILSNETLQNALRGLLIKPITENKILIISINTNKEPYKSRLENVKQIMVEMGFLIENISLYNLSERKPTNIKDVDVLYVFGGNDYYYLHHLRETGLMQDIRDFIIEDGIYVGVSAGAKIMGPEIDVNLTPDENDIGLNDTSGFGLIPFYIIPHWDWREHRMEYLEYSWKTGKRIVPLTDQQAVLVCDDKIKII